MWYFWLIDSSTHMMNTDESWMLDFSPGLKVDIYGNDEKLYA